MVIIDKCLANKSKKLQLRKNRFIFIDERCKFPLGSNSKLEMYAYNTLFDTILLYSQCSKIYINRYLQETGND